MPLPPSRIAEEDAARLANACIECGICSDVQDQSVFNQCSKCNAKICNTCSFKLTSSRCPFCNAEDSIVLL